MAKLIKPDGTTQTIQPQDGKVFTLDEMRTCVEGYIEAVPYTRELVMYVNDDGFERLPYNDTASTLLHAHRPDRRGTLLYGNVLIASLYETGDESNVLHVTTKQVEAACTECGHSPSLEWNLYGMTGILCRDCLAKEVDNVNHTMDTTGW